jgi:serine/threonine protein kinase
MVMEYVDGLSLEKWLLRQRGAIPEVTGLRILLATAFALSAAHAEGITHRDLKPSNLLLTKKGQLKLADLGLAREMGSAHLTRDRVAVGTPAYMAPESLTPGSTPDFRVDLYALGVMGYVLAFGKLPYNGDVTQVLAGHLRGNADFMCPTTWSGPAVQLVRRLLSVDPAKRPPHALSVVTTVRGFLAGTGRHRREAAQSSGSSSDITQLGRFLDGAFAAHTTTVEGRTITHTTRSERRLVWTVLAVVILIAGSGWWLSRGEARSAAASTQPAKLADSAEASVVPAPEKVGGGTQ